MLFFVILPIFEQNCPKIVQNLAVFWTELGRFNLVVFAPVHVCVSLHPNLMHDYEDNTYRNSRVHR